MPTTAAAPDELAPADLARAKLVDQVVLDLAAAPPDLVHPALGLAHFAPVLPLPPDLADGLPFHSWNGGET